MARSRPIRCLVALALVATFVAPGPLVALAYDPVAPNAVVDLTPTVYMNRVQWWPGGHEQPIVVRYHTPRASWRSTACRTARSTSR